MRINIYQPLLECQVFVFLQNHCPLVTCSETLGFHGDDDSRHGLQVVTLCDDMVGLHCRGPCCLHLQGEVNGAGM